MRFAAIASILLATAAPAAQSDNGGRFPGTLRLSQIRRASDDELVRLVFGPVAAFPYPSLRDGVENRRLLQRVRLWFYSRARAADRIGVCFTQRLIVSFEAVPGSDRRDPLLRPGYYELQTYYIVSNPEAARRNRGAGEGRFARDEACAALDPRRDGIPAESAFQLMNAIGLVETLAAEARTGRLSVPLDCSASHFFADAPADEAACLAELSGLVAPQIGWVRSCPPRREAAGGCTQVLIGRFWLEFDLAPGQSMTRVTVSGVEDTSAVQ